MMTDDFAEGMIRRTVQVSAKLFGGVSVNLCACRGIVGQACTDGVERLLDLVVGEELANGPRRLLARQFREDRVDRGFGNRLTNRADAPHSRLDAMPPAAAGAEEHGVPQILAARLQRFGECCIRDLADRQVALVGAELRQPFEIGIAEFAVAVSQEATLKHVPGGTE